MRWQTGRRSENVEDRGGGSGGRIALGGGGTLALALAVYLLGGDPTGILINGMRQGFEQQGSVSQMDPAEAAREKDFVSSVLASTEDVWRDQFERNGAAYTNPKLILFSGATQSGCGYAQSAAGPFYCPADQDVYLDLNFFTELETRFGASGDFARAYVIAHEIGHHVQKLVGTEDKIYAEMQSSSKKAANALSVKLELQADCYAGIWAYHANTDYNLVEAGDIDEALNAASRIGDDTLQKETQGHIVPDSFTHGTSAQRHQWFDTGFKSGDMAACDTFE